MAGGAYGSGNVNIGVTAGNVFRPEHIRVKMYGNLPSRMYIDNLL